MEATTKKEMVALVAPRCVGAERKNCGARVSDRDFLRQRSANPLLRRLIISRINLITGRSHGAAYTFHRVVLASNQTARFDYSRPRTGRHRAAVFRRGSARRPAVLIHSGAASLTGRMGSTSCGRPRARFQRRHHQRAAASAPPPAIAICARRFSISTFVISKLRMAGCSTTMCVPQWPSKAATCTGPRCQRRAGSSNCTWENSLGNHPLYNS